MTKADELLKNAYAALQLTNSSYLQKYANISNIVNYLTGQHAISSIAVGTTGTISERLCTLGLEDVKASNKNFDFRLFGKDWKWVGDILVLGDPYDVAISVKSYKAKERLLASGTGSLLTPTIGWGLFDDVKEWSIDRTKSYLYRGFIAIYMPQTTLVNIGINSKCVNNINGRPLLRDLQEFPIDLKNAMSPNGRLNFKKL